MEVDFAGLSKGVVDIITILAHISIPLVCDNATKIGQFPQLLLSHLTLFTVYLRQLFLQALDGLKGAKRLLCLS